MQPQPPLMQSFRKLMAALSILWLWLFIAGAAAAQQAPAAAPLDDKDCLACHETKAKKIQVAGKEGEKPRALKAVPADQFRQGAHARLQCVACHKDITDNPKAGESHAKPADRPIAKPDCQGCHLELQERIQQGQVRGSSLLESVAVNMDAHKRSLHAKPNADDPTRANANCVDCHNTHTFKIPPKTAPEYAAWRAGIPKLCGSCHEEQLESYETSVHHKHNTEKGDAKAAVCSDCHSAHLVTNTSANRFKVDISSMCGNCHKERYQTFQDTFHGAVVTLGYGHTAKCYNCHGSHEILSAEDPKSKVHPTNRLKTCASCHDPKKGLPAVSEGFASFQPHADPHDFKNYPTVALAYWGMIGLLVGTFAFFWVHTILWFIREWKERKARGGDHLVRVDEVPGPKRGLHFQRFNSVQRGAHLLFAISLMVLTFTGMPLFYPEAPWARWVMELVGGPQSAGFIHRVAAVLFAAIFFWHLFYVAYRIGRNWRTFKFFGPDSLVPWIDDLKGIIAMFKWFFGLGPRPVFDRWTYWEKFDYWAPFWGVTIIGVSGLVMWLPHVFGKFLPGWVFNVATIMHGEEAFLAVVFLFTVHFFNNHFRPDKFPVDVVMFTGTQSLEEFKREHALQYERLVANGELESRLVPAPSRAHVAASKVLAFVLIVIGLTLLTLVGIGFFTAGG